MQVLNITVNEDGSVNQFAPDFKITRGSYRNVLLNMRVPHSLLLNPVTDTDTGENQTGNNVRIAAVVRTATGHNLKTKRYNFQRVTDYQNNGQWFRLYQRRIPKEFTMWETVNLLEATNSGILEMIINVVNWTKDPNNGKRKIEEVAASPIFKLDIYPSDFLDETEEIEEPSNFDELHSQVQDLDARVTNDIAEFKEEVTEKVEGLEDRIETVEELSAETKDIAQEAKDIANTANEKADATAISVQEQINDFTAEVTGQVNDLTSRVEAVEDLSAETKEIADDANEKSDTAVALAEEAVETADRAEFTAASANTTALEAKETAEYSLTVAESKIEEAPNDGLPYVRQDKQWVLEDSGDWWNNEMDTDLPPEVTKDQVILTNGQNDMMPGYTPQNEQSVATKKYIDDELEEKPSEAPNDGKIYGRQAVIVEQGQPIEHVEMQWQESVTKAEIESLNESLSDLDNEVNEKLNTLEDEFNEKLNGLEADVAEKADKTTTVAGKALSGNITLDTLTIQKNGTNIDTYNGSAAKTINITAPTQTSDLTNNGDGSLAGGLTDPYAKISQLPTVPTQTSQLTNNGDGTLSGGLTDPYAKVSQVPTKAADIGAIDNTAIYQTTGTSTTGVMSQNAITNEFNKVETTWATATTGGVIKMRVDGDTLYITNNGSNA